MVTLASLWLLFLIIAVLSTAIALTLQLRNMMKLASGGILNETNPFAGFFKGFIPVMIFGLAGTVSWILFFIAVLANLVGAR